MGCPWAWGSVGRAQPKGFSNIVALVLNMLEREGRVGEIIPDIRFGCENDR